MFKCSESEHLNCGHMKYEIELWKTKLKVKKLNYLCKFKIGRFCDLFTVQLSFPDRTNYNFLGINSIKIRKLIPTLGKKIPFSSDFIKEWDVKLPFRRKFFFCNIFHIDIEKYSYWYRQSKANQLLNQLLNKYCILLPGYAVHGQFSKGGYRTHITTFSLKNKKKNHSHWFQILFLLSHFPLSRQEMMHFIIKT